MTTPRQQPVAAIVYLDVDDEITSAAARIRSTREPRLALVLPSGSRVSTSRINFRLLAREAELYGRDLSIVAPDGATRALAATAGLPIFASVAEFEDALETAERDQPDTPEPPAAEPGGPQPDVGSQTGSARTQVRPLASAPGPPSTPAAASPRSDRRPAPIVRPRSSVTDTVVMPVPEYREERPGRRISGWILATATLLIVLVLAAGAGAWLLLPTATITVAARVEPVGPLTFTVRADPLEVTEDAAAGIVPAQVVTFDLSVSNDFPATGKKVTETKATGSVRWTNCDPTRSYTIPANTAARTSDGIKFSSVTAVFLPVAILTGSPPVITCQSRDVAVTASNPGTDGNVDGGTVTVVPSDYNSVVIRVTNPKPTAGGTHTETAIVAQKDVDAAMTALTKVLRDQFTAQLADPSRTPAGMTLFPATKSMSSADPTLDPASLVGNTASTFTLGLTASGTATAVDTATIQALADARIRGAVPSGMALLKGSVDVRLGTAHVDGSAVLYAVTARASAFRVPDAAEIRRVVRGLTVDEARERLRDYGDAQIDTWPGWVTTIPNLDFRLVVEVVSNLTTEPIVPAPSESPITSNPPPSATSTPPPTLPPLSASPVASPSGSPRPSGT